MLRYLPTALVVLAFALTLARRWEPVLTEYLGRRYVRWSWAPPALVLGLSRIVAELGALSGAPEFSPEIRQTLAVVDTVSQVIIGIWLAAQKGHESEPTTKPPAATTQLVPPLLGVLLFALVMQMQACTRQPEPKTGRDARPVVVCSDASIEVVDGSCAAIVGLVEPKQRDVTQAACETLIRAQALVCGDK